MYWNSNDSGGRGVWQIGGISRAIHGNRVISVALRERFAIKFAINCQRQMQFLQLLQYL